MYCPECGEQSDRGQGYCEHCGSRLPRSSSHKNRRRNILILVIGLPTIALIIVLVVFLIVPKIDDWLSETVDQPPEQIYVEGKQPESNAPTTSPTANNPPTITKAEYDQLEVGMSYKQVVDIIGGEPAEQTESTSTSGTILTCTWYGGESGAQQGICYVMFADGKVYQKVQEGLP